MRVGMFLGVETATWSVSNFLVESQYLHAQGVDTILVKVADGGNLWYGGYGGIDNVLKAIKDGGCAALPYMYSYGDKFNYLDGEAGIANRFTGMGYDFCMDMEAEWNGQGGWATTLVGLLNHPVYVSTWADPDLQSWDTVLPTLEPKTIKYLPQVYTQWLADNWHSEFQARGVPDSKIVMTVASATYLAAKGWPDVTMWEAVNFSRTQISEVIKSLSTTINPNTKVQAEKVWAIGGNVPFDTGIANTWLNLYLGQIGTYGNVNLGSPNGGEVDTVDWSGIPIKYHEFKNGHIEWYTTNEGAHRPGEHHVWFYGHKLY